MIKLSKLNKFFNKGKDNEIHVLNDITLELPDKGLVVLLGPSGSGKTTLLNVLSGLDKIQSGVIDFNGQEIKKYNSSVWDKIRNREVGYIFQNYNLLPELTVYDNISLTLNMIGIIDKNDLDKRIDYLLDSVGLIKYRKRKAAQLSGGQQQRVAIARALAKNPRVIIADEPTGNLDSKNTIDVMNIIKKVSSEKLVVLVTHEKNIADFYADRVIELLDGTIVNDYLNRNSGDLNVQYDTDIYLKDLNNFESYNSKKLKIEVFSDDNINPEMKVRLIVKNRTLYLEINQDEYQKIKLITSDSETKVYDKHYEALTKKEFNKIDFKYKEIIGTSKNMENRSVITIKDSIRTTLQKISNLSIGGKLFYLGFAASAILIAIAIGVLSNILYIEDEEFMTYNKDTIFTVYDSSIPIFSDLSALENQEFIDYIDYSIMNFSFKYVTPPLLSRHKGQNLMVSGFLEQDSEISSEDLIYGRMPEDNKEIVIDKMIANHLLASQNYIEHGITSYELLLKNPIKKTTNERSIELTIVGVSDTTSQSIYVSEPYYIMSYTGELVSEIYPERDNTSTALQVKQEFINGNNIKSYSILKINANNIQKTLDYLKDNNAEAEFIYAEERNDYKNRTIKSGVGIIFFSGIVLIASSVSYYFIIRSSLISRIYEISVYRALGVLKRDIYKMFITEIFIITSLSSIIGFILASFILIRINMINYGINTDFNFIYFSYWNILIGIVFIYSVNLLSGVIPVIRLLRKTPSEILCKYDL